MEKRGGYPAIADVCGPFPWFGVYSTLFGALVEKVAGLLNEPTAREPATGFEALQRTLFNRIDSGDWSDVYPIVLAVVALVVAWMSWTQRISQLSGRWSPFTRSPATAGPAQVNDSDFSYITTEDLKNGAYDRNDGPPRDTDTLNFKNKRNLYTVHFPAYSIDRGELTIGEMRAQAAKKIGCDPKRLKMLYKGKSLKDDVRSCREEGLREGVDVMCIASEGAVEPPSSSDSEGELSGADDDAKGGDQPKRKRNRNRNKKKKGKKQSSALDSDHLAPGTAETSRTASPAPPPTPATPQDKLNALHDKLQTLLPQCHDYMANPPADAAKRDFEYKKLSETILAQVLIKLDGVETDEPELRARRKELVREAQKVLNELDAAKGV